MSKTKKYIFGLLTFLVLCLLVVGYFTKLKNCNTFFFIGWDDCFTTDTLYFLLFLIASFFWFVLVIYQIFDRLFNKHGHKFLKSVASFVFGFYVWKYIFVLIIKTLGFWS